MLYTLQSVRSLVKCTLACTVVCLGDVRAGRINEIQSPLFGNKQTLYIIAVKIMEFCKESCNTGMSV